MPCSWVGRVLNCEIQFHPNWCIDAKWLYSKYLLFLKEIDRLKNIYEHKKYLEQSNLKK